MSGLQRDFTAAFNAPGYSPWAAKATSDENVIEKQQRTAAKNLAHRKKISFQEAMVIVKAPDFVGNAIKKKATRVNPEANWCEASGMTLQTREIRAEMHKAKTQTSAN